MPNLVGIGNSQVPTNAMLGGLAYQDSVGEINLEKIKARTDDTATDIFVYDTRKDSDGGAWRKKATTQSWYNEDESGTRGARKEFPSVAVIVVTSSNMAIYDGDNPTLPMWMIFTSSNTTWLKHTTSGPNSVVALNGNIVTCGAGAAGRLSVVNFISDDGYVTEAGYTYRHSSIATRNSTGVGPIDTTNPLHIVNIDCKDVAITVLPNAPIDASTGLPIPTIVVATAGGVSVIKDDGSVVDLITSHSGYEQCNFTGIADNQVLLSFESSGSTTARRFWVHDIPSSDTTVTSSVIVQGSADEFYKDYNASFSGNALNYHTYPDYKVTNKTLLTSNYLYLGLDKNLAIIHRNKNSAGGEDGMLCGITTNFNTGWQQGDIRCALLSDTDATDVSHSNVASNWATASNWTYQNQKISLTSNGSQISITHDDGGGSYVYSYLPLTVEANSDYNIDIEFGAYNSSDLEVVPGIYNSSNERVVLHGVSGTRKSGYFTSGSNTTLYLMINHNNTTATTINNIVVQKIIEKDRSVRVKGLTVYGTVKKRLVAAGAELVSYNNLTNSNYLEQPYNSDLNFGTGDFCIMGWFYNLGTSASILYRLHNSTSAGIGYIVATSSGGEIGYSSYTQGFSSSGRITHYTSDSWNGLQNWNMFVCGKKGGNGFMYVNGVLKQTGTNANSHTDTTYSPTLRIGNNHAGNGGIGGGKLALIRISSTFPSIEQIRKMYNDEKQLFSERAKCTLIGTSDAVTALAYDDSNTILHVGTSGGRSEFRGLKRINNTTTAVTTAISASNELVAEQ